MDEKKQLKILIVSQYFWPENFRVNDIAKYLKEKGAEVEILTGKPNYPGGDLFRDFKAKILKILNTMEPIFIEFQCIQGKMGQIRIYS